MRAKKETRKREQERKEQQEKEEVMEIEQIKTGHEERKRSGKTCEELKIM